MELSIQPLKEEHYTAVKGIYAEGIETGKATFETKIINWHEWDTKYIEPCRLIAKLNHSFVGFACLSKVSSREVYSGVAEVSIYISKEHRGKGLGEVLLKAIIEESEKNGFWTLQSSIFKSNLPSIQLHTKCGFRKVGIREKIGKLNGAWFDNIIFEKRSKHIL